MGDKLPAVIICIGWALCLVALTSLVLAACS